MDSRKKFPPSTARTVADKAPTDPLSNREEEILRLLADGLSDREISDRLFLSLNTIKWHNRQIYSKLGVSSRTQAVAQAAQEGLLAWRPAQEGPIGAPRRAGLPAQVTSFMGRVREIDEVKRLMESNRLLTLLGPGGVGKTRLACEVAARVMHAGAFKDGLCFVDLAPVKQPEWVGEVVLNALGVMPAPGEPVSKTLADRLWDKELLLILDNFEHVLGAALLVGDLLASAPDIKVLSTSRQALGLYGEQRYPVPSLDLPERESLATPSLLGDNESVALFVQRARAVKPDFKLTDENAPLVAEICIRLDGLPLAIELAAAQMHLLSPRILLDQLHERATGLAGGQRGRDERYQTLRGAIDWSFELLDPSQKAMFEHLSVFRGGASIEAARAVCLQDEANLVLEGLGSLVDKNLVTMQEGPGGEPRFSMLETICEFARECLVAEGEEDQTGRRHAEYFADLAKKARHDTRGGPLQLARLHQLQLENENLRTALGWSLGGGDVVLGCQLTGSLGHFWWRQGHYGDGHRWTELALQSAEDFDLPLPVLAALLDTAGLVAHYSLDRELGKQFHQRALEIYRQLGDQREQGWVLIYLAAQSFAKADEYVSAMGYSEEALALFRQVGDQAGVAQALHVIGELARLHGDLPRAQEALARGLDLTREVGDTLRQAWILDSLGYIELYEGDVSSAAICMSESLELTLAAGYAPHIPACLAGIAAIFLADGEPGDGARLLGAADAAYAAHGFSPRPSDTPDVERTRERLKETLGEGPFEAAWNEGIALTLDRAVDLALAPTPSR